MEGSLQDGAPLPSMRRSRLPADLDALSARIISAAIEVHRTLGPGFVESVYEYALAVEFANRAIRYARQYPVTVLYRGVAVGEHRLDFVIADAIVVELKAIDALSGVHEAQVISYLKAGAYKLGLLMSFNVDLLRRGLRRVVHPDYFK